MHQRNLLTPNVQLRPGRSFKPYVPTSAVSRQATPSNAHWQGRELSELIGCWLLPSLLLFAVSCRTVPPLPPLDLAQPGWSVRHGQAIWQPHPQSPETLGEVLVALHSSGDSLVEFSKTPFSILSVQRTAKQWQLHSAMENRVRRGAGTVPTRSLWLHVASVLQGAPLPEPIQVTPTGPNQWTLRQTRTGERLALVLEP